MADPPIASEPDSPTPLTVVVAGVIYNGSGEVLLAQRPHGSHMAGLWELPGGKVRHGEAPAQALIRELQEELDIVVRVGEPITFAMHEEPGLRILLLFFSASITAGQPRPLENQQLDWVPPDRLAEYPMPPADTALVRELQRRASLHPATRDH